MFFSLCFLVKIAELHKLKNKTMSQFQVKVSTLSDKLPFDLSESCKLLEESFREYMNSTELKKGEGCKIYITNVRISTEFFIQIVDTKKIIPFCSRNIYALKEKYFSLMIRQKTYL